MKGTQLINLHLPLLQCLGSTQAISFIYITSLMPTSTLKVCLFYVYFMIHVRRQAYFGIFGLYGLGAPWIFLRLNVAMVKNPVLIPRKETTSDVHSEVWKKNAWHQKLHSSQRAKRESKTDCHGNPRESFICRAYFTHHFEGVMKKTFIFHCVFWVQRWRLGV